MIEKKRAALSSRPKLAKSTLLEGERCALVEGASAESNDCTDPIKNGLTLLLPSTLNYSEFPPPIRRSFCRVRRGNCQRRIQ
jgi:hypothetical protein